MQRKESFTTGSFMVAQLIAGQKPLVFVRRCLSDMVSFVGPKGRGIGLASESM